MFTPIKFRSAFGYDTNLASAESHISCPEPSLAVQSSKDECDINTIVRRFGLTGQLPDNVSAPVYADFHEVYDYHTAMNQIKAAEGAFMSMPADIRSRFRNDPNAFVDFCSDDSNRAEAEKLGLVFPRSNPIDAFPDISHENQGVKDAMSNDPKKSA